VTPYILTRLACVGYSGHARSQARALLDHPQLAVPVADCAPARVVGVMSSSKPGDLVVGVVLIVYGSLPMCSMVTSRAVQPDVWVGKSARSAERQNRCRRPLPFFASPTVICRLGAILMVGAISSWSWPAGQFSAGRAKCPCRSTWAIRASSGNYALALFFRLADIRPL